MSNLLPDDWHLLSGEYSDDNLNPTAPSDSTWELLVENIEQSKNAMRAGTKGSSTSTPRRSTFQETQLGGLPTLRRTQSTPAKSLDVRKHSDISWWTIILRRFFKQPSGKPTAYVLVVSAESLENWASQDANIQRWVDCVQSCRAACCGVATGGQKFIIAKSYLDHSPLAGS